MKNIEYFGQLLRKRKYKCLQVKNKVKKTKIRIKRLLQTITN